MKELRTVGDPGNIFVMESIGLSCRPPEPNVCDEANDKSDQMPVVSF